MCRLVHGHGRRIGHPAQVDGVGVIDGRPAIEILVGEEWTYRWPAGIDGDIGNGRTRCGASLGGGTGRTGGIGPLYYVEVGGSRRSPRVRKGGREHAAGNLVGARGCEPGRGTAKNTIADRAGRCARGPAQVHLVAGNRRRTQPGWDRGYRAIGRQEAVYTQLAAADIGRTKTAQIHLAVRNGGVAILGEVAARIPAGVLLVVPKLCGDIVGVVSPKHTGHRTVIGIAAENRIGPHDAIRVTVGRKRKVGAGFAADKIGAGLEVGGVQRAAIELEGLQVVALGPHVDFGAIYRAIPVHSASMQRSSKFDRLHRGRVTQMAQAGAVDDVPCRGLAHHDQPAPWWNQQRAGSVEIQVSAIQVRVVRGAKPVCKGEVGVEFDEALAEVRNPIPGTVAGAKVNAAGAVHGWALP